MILVLRFCGLCLLCTFSCWGVVMPYVEDVSVFSCTLQLPSFTLKMGTAVYIRILEELQRMVQLNAES
jgi:hypothetical protein